MAGKTVYVDSMGILYVLNPDGSRTYLTGALTGKTVSASSDQSSLNVVNSGSSSNGVNSIISTEKPSYNWFGVIFSD